MPLREVPPEPIQPDEVAHKAADVPHKKRELSAFLTSVLTRLQKYSAFVFTGFAFLHTTTVMTPLGSVEAANQLLSMSRTVYHAPGMETALVWAPLTVHVFSGIALRLIRNYKFRQLHDASRRHDSSAVRARKDVLVKNPDKEAGLIGGFANYFGLGVKKSLSFKKFGLSPLQLSGYVCIPLLGIHILQARILPKLVEGDSSLVSFEYIGFIMNKNPILNWVVYPSLLLFLNYHIISGLITYLKVKNFKLRKLSISWINLLTLVGSYNLYLLSKLDFSSMQAFVLKQFEKYSYYI